MGVGSFFISEGGISKLTLTLWELVEYYQDMSFK
jgi:hypothetical protein